MRLAVAVMKSDMVMFGIGPTIETVFITNKSDVLTEKVYKEIVATFKRPVISITKLEEVDDEE